MVTEGQPLSDDNASFLRAARGGNLEKVLEYLKANTDINTCNANGLNALHLAAKEGHVAVVKELLTRGAKIDAATKKGNTALHIASLAGQDEVVRLLVDNGGSVNVQSQNGFTPLYMAAQENHDGVVRFLLASGANQSLATEDGFTPLAVALQQGHDKVVAVLLENDTRGKVRLPALHIAAKKDDTKAAGLLLQSGDHNPDVTSKSGFTPLHIAAHYGNENIASLLLQRNANVNYAAKHNITPLHVAAKWGKANMVSLLLDKGANLESKTRDGLTPLHCAARSGHENVVDMMLQRGAPISAKTKNGLAPLHMASQGDHVDAARILLHHKAPVDEVTVDYLTALHVAAHCGHVRVAKLLLDRKADPNARALNGFTPLHIACKKNRIKVVELLLKYGASIEATTESGLTPLHVASFMGCMNIVIFLIQNQASPDEATVRGETPLHLAARANQTDIIRILLRNGAKVDARAREQQTPLHIASRLGNVDIVLLLLQSGAQVDANTKDLYTALHIAAKEGQEEVASVLMDHNASLVSVTKKGFTPLHLAAKYGNLKVSSLILEKNCTPAVVDAEGKNGVTPLHVAAHYDHQNVALLLLDKGASPHASAKNGYTPLHITAKKNQLDIASSLLEYGAKTDADSKAGFTPLHLASQEGHVDVTNLLLKNGADPNAKAKNGLAPIHLCAQEDRVNVAAILAANGADLDGDTKAGYTPLLVASHFGNVNMARFLLERDVKIDTQNELGYTPLHQAAQQGHTQIVNMLLENNASPNTLAQNGQTALSVAQRLGYISVVETLKTVTESDVSAQNNVNNTAVEEKYKVNAPESMQETFMSDSEDEGVDENMIGEHSYKYLTVDEMKSLGDDSMPIDVTHDEKQHKESQGQTSINALAGPPGSIEEKLAALEKTRDYKNSINEKYLEPDNVDLPSRHAVKNGLTSPDVDTVDRKISGPAAKLSSKRFLVSFMVDARGGAMRGCRHSGVRVIIPPRKAPMPMRITCRYLKKDKLIHPPPMMEGEAIASRILELGPSGAKFLGPVIIEVPHFAALRGKEREIVILRSDNGETWKEHTLEATEDAVQEVLQESFDPDELSKLEDLNTNRITRILTTDFPQYFAIVSRIRQEVHAIGPEGGVVNSSVVPQVQAVFPQGALTKKIKVGLQAHPIPPELTAKLLGNRVAVSPIVTVEPRRRKFHKPITLTIPVPQAAGKGMINQYTGETPTLRLLCSITGVFRKRSLKGGTTRAQWEDVTGSTPLTFVNDCVNFTTTVSARFWLMDCRNIAEATKMATELYREAIHVPFMAKFVVFAKRHETLEARLRVFCMTDDKEDKTLEHQEHFLEVAKSRDVEVLEGKSHYVEFGGNLVPVTKSGDQLSLRFFAFRENRLPFSVKVKDPHSEALGRVAFMREPKSARQDAPQTPICNLNVALPDNITPEMGPADVDTEAIESKYSFLREAGYGKFETVQRADLRISDIGNLLGLDWVNVAHELDMADSDINIIKSEYPENIGQQAMVMLRLWLNNEGNRATGSVLERALRKCDRKDIVNKCIFNTETDIEVSEQETAKTPTTPDQAEFDSFKEELGPSRESTLPRQEAFKDDQDDENEIEGGKLADEERISEKMTLQQKLIHETVSDSKAITDENEILLEKSQKYCIEEENEIKYSAEEKTFYTREVESSQKVSEVIDSKLTSVVTEEVHHREESTYHERFENDIFEEKELRKETIYKETLEESLVQESSMVAKAETFVEKRENSELDNFDITSKDQEDDFVKEALAFKLQQAEEHEILDEDVNESCDVDEKSYQEDEDGGSSSIPHPKVIVMESTDKESETESKDSTTEAEANAGTDSEADEVQEECDEEPLIQVQGNFSSNQVESEVLVEVEEEICQEVIIKKRRDENDFADEGKILTQTRKSVEADDSEADESEDQTTHPSEVQIRLHEAPDESEEDDESSRPSHPTEVEIRLHEAPDESDEEEISQPSHPTDVEIRLHEAPDRTADSDEEALELVKQQQQIERDHYSQPPEIAAAPILIEREAVHAVLDEDDVLEEAVSFTDDNGTTSRPEEKTASTPPPSPIDPYQIEKTKDTPSLEEVAAIAHYKKGPQRESTEDSERRFTSSEEEAADRISPEVEDLADSSTTIGFVAIESTVDFGQIKLQSEFDIKEKGFQETTLSKGFTLTSSMLEKTKVTSIIQEELRSPTDSQLSSSGLWSDTGISLGDLSAKPQSLDLLDQSVTTDLGDLSEMSPVKQTTFEQLAEDSESSSESAKQITFAAAQKVSVDSCTSPLKDQQAESASSPITWPAGDVSDIGTDPAFEQPLTFDAKLSPILFVESKGTSPMSSQGDTPCMVDATSSPPKSLMVSAQTSPPALDDEFFYTTMQKFKGFKDSPEGGEQLPFQIDMDSPDKAQVLGEISRPHFVLGKLPEFKSPVSSQKEEQMLKDEKEPEGYKVENNGRQEYVEETMEITQDIQELDAQQTKEKFIKVEKTKEVKMVKTVDELRKNENLLETKEEIKVQEEFIKAEIEEELIETDEEVKMEEKDVDIANEESETANMKFETEVDFNDEAKEPIKVCEEDEKDDLETDSKVNVLEKTVYSLQSMEPLELKNQEMKEYIGEHVGLKLKETDEDEVEEETAEFPIEERQAKSLNDENLEYKFQIESQEKATNDVELISNTQTDESRAIEEEPNVEESIKARDIEDQDIQIEIESKVSETEMKDLEQDGINAEKEEKLMHFSENEKTIEEAESSLNQDHSQVVTFDQIDYWQEIKSMACNLETNITKATLVSEQIEQECFSYIPHKCFDAEQEVVLCEDEETSASKTVTFSQEVFFSSEQSEKDEECFYQVKVSEISSQIEKGESFDSSKFTDSKSEEIDELLLLVMPPGHARLNVEDQDDSEFDQVNAPRIIVTPTIDDDFSDYYQESLPEETVLENRMIEETASTLENFTEEKDFIDAAIKCSLLHSRKFWSSDENLEVSSTSVQDHNLLALIEDIGQVSQEETVYCEVRELAGDKKLQDDPTALSPALPSERGFILYQEFEQSSIKKRPSSVETVEEEYESGYEITTGREMKSFDDSTLMEQSLEIYQQSEKTDSLLQESTMHESLSMEKTLSEPTIEPDLPSDNVEEFDYDIQVKKAQKLSDEQESLTNTIEDEVTFEIHHDVSEFAIHDEQKKVAEDSKETSNEDSLLLKRIVFESTEELFYQDSSHQAEDYNKTCQKIHEEGEHFYQDRTDEFEELQDDYQKNEEIHEPTCTKLELESDFSKVESSGFEEVSYGKQSSVKKDIDEAENLVQDKTSKDIEDKALDKEEEEDLKPSEESQKHSRSKTFTRQFETQTLVSAQPVTETVELMPIISWNLIGDQAEFVKNTNALQNEILDTFELDGSRQMATEQCFSPGQDSFIPSSRCSERSGTQSSIELHSISSKSESSQSHSTRVISESLEGTEESRQSHSSSATPGDAISVSPFSSTRYSCGSQSTSRTPSDLSQNNLDSKSGSSFVDPESASANSDVTHSKSSISFQNTSSVSTHSSSNGSRSSGPTHSSVSKSLQISTSEVERSCEESRSQATTTDSDLKKESTTSTQNENEEEAHPLDGSDELSASACSLPSSPRRLRRTHSSGVKKITSEIFSTESDITRSLEIVYTEPAENPRRKLSEKYRHASSNGASETSISNETQKVEKRKPSVTMIKKRSNEDIPLSESQSHSSSDLDDPAQTEPVLEKGITEKIQPSPTKLKEPKYLPKTASITSEEIIAPVLQVVCQTPERSQRHLFKYVEDENQTDEEKVKDEDVSEKNGLSKSFLQSETHPVRQQKSSSYEDDESSHQGSASPETGKVRHESTSSSGSSSKRSIGSRGSPDDQARLLESADQELMDEMVVRDDVDDVAFGRQKETIEEEKKMEMESALSPLTSSRDENSQSKIDFQKGQSKVTENLFDSDPFDPLGMKDEKETFFLQEATSSSGSFNRTNEPLIKDHKDLIVSVSGEVSKGSSESGDENVIRVGNYEAEETQMLLKDSSESEDGEVMVKETFREMKTSTSSGIVLLESVVMPSEEESHLESQTLEFKAIPSDKQSSQIDSTQLVTMQIKGGIISMELSQSEDPVMTDRSISATGPTFSTEFFEESREKVSDGKSMVKFCSSSFESSVDTKSISESPELSPPPQPATKEVKKSSIKFMEEKCPISKSRLMEDEGVKQAAEDLVKAMKMKAVEIVQEIHQRPNHETEIEESSKSEVITEDKIEAVREVASDFVSSLTTRAVRLAEKIVPIIRTDIVSTGTDIPDNFTLQTSFRSHYVVAFDPRNDEEPGANPTPSNKIVENDGADDFSDSYRKGYRDETENGEQGDDQRHFSSGQGYYSPTNLDEDIWADQSKVIYRNKIPFSSTSSSFKKTASDSESISKACDRRSGTDFESSSDLYHTAHDSSSGLSRPGSSDVEILLSAISHKSSDLTTEYDTAQTSHRSNATTSGEYHTAVSSLMSEESLKSHDESSGNLGSIEISEAASDTLKDAHVDLDRESLCTPSGPPHEEIFQGLHENESPLIESSSVSDTEDDSSYVSHMVRSKEMMFHQDPLALETTNLHSNQAEDMEEEFNQSIIAPHVDLASLSESRDTLSASILTISSTSEVTMLQAKEAKGQIMLDEEVGFCEIEEQRMEHDVITPAVTTQFSSKPAPLPRVVSFERAVVFESLRISEQKSIDSELESRPESELKELDSRPQSILSRSSSEDPRPLSKDEFFEQDTLTVKEPFARPVTPEPPEKVVVKNTVVFSVDALEMSISPHSDKLDQLCDISVDSPTMVSRPLGVKYWPPSDDLNMEDDCTAPMVKQKVFRSESDDNCGEDRQHSEEMDKEIEDRKKWLERQFEDPEASGDMDAFQYLYSQPLDQIMEEEDERESLDDLTEKELRKLKESLINAPDFDALNMKRHLVLRGDREDVISMSSLQEFERLEREVALHGSGSESRGSIGSQDSLEVLGIGAPIKGVAAGFAKKLPSKSGQGDDISVDSHTSLQEFERMEAACKEAETNEKKAKEQEECLSEIEEGHESQISESESCETLSEAGRSDNSDEYEQRMFQIEEIIKQAQTNVEKFQDSQKKPEQEMLPLDEILGWSESKVRRSTSVSSAESDSLEAEAEAVCTEDKMQRSVDSLELKTKSSRSKRMETSSDSLDFKTGGVMTLSTDSIEQDQVAAGKSGLMTESTDSLDGVCVMKSELAFSNPTPTVHGAAAALITSSDSLDSCSNNTRATASMLSSLTSNASETVLTDLEHDTAGQFQNVKKYLTGQSEIHIDSSDESVSIGSNTIFSSSTQSKTARSIDPTDIVALRRNQQGLGIVQQAIFKDM